MKYAKDKQVARCGNAVPPPFAEALVRANLPELCAAREQAALSPPECRLTAAFLYLIDNTDRYHKIDL